VDVAEATPPALHEGDHHQREADQDARQDAGGEKAAHRQVQMRPDDDHDRGGRNDRPDERARRRDRCRERAAIAFAHHRGDHDRPDRGEIAEDGARDAREKHGCEDVHMRKPAPDPADHELRQRDQPVGHVEAVQQLARQHEHRQRQKRDLGDGIVHLRHEQERRQPRARHEEEEGRG
jgi:hypothetical protein